MFVVVMQLPWEMSPSGFAMLKLNVHVGTVHNYAV